MKYLPVSSQIVFLSIFFIYNFYKERVLLQYSFTTQTKFFLNLTIKQFNLFLLNRIISIVEILSTPTFKFFEVPKFPVS